MIKKWCRKLKSTLRTNLSSCVNYRLTFLTLLDWSLTITATHFIFWFYLINKSMTLGTLLIRNPKLKNSPFAFSYSRASPNHLNVQSTARCRSHQTDAIDTRMIKSSVRTLTLIRHCNLPLLKSAIVFSRTALLSDPVTTPTSTKYFSNSSANKCA